MKIAVLSLFVLAGCAANQNWAWDKPNSSEQEFYMDHGQCRAQAFGVPGVSLMQAALVLDGCMNGKGWRRVPK